MYKIQILLLILALTTQKHVFYQEINLTSEKLKDELNQELSEKSKDNIIKLTIDPPSLLEKKLLILIIESTNPNLILNFFQTEEGVLIEKSRILLTQNTYSGNFLFITNDQFFSSSWDKIKETGELFFQITDNELTGSKLFTVKILIAETIDLPMNKIYTTILSPKVNDLKANFTYDGTKYPNLQKLRFQLTKISSKAKHQMTSYLNHEGDSFQMNNIFSHILGGILNSQMVKICKKDNCLYTLNITLLNVRVFNIETYLIEEIEEISIFHLNEYYDRVYKQNQETYYRLKYVDDMEGMDVSVNLIPVTGETSLYVNAKTKPLELDKYDYKEIGTLAKRITVRWEDLELMKATKSDLFITVQTKNKGEFLIKIDAHESHYRGRLSPGVAEQGFVKENELARYLCVFDLYKNQEIEFETKLQVFSGEAFLYLKQCNFGEFCDMKEEELEKALVKIENKNNEKSISQKFTCQQKNDNPISNCNFLVVIKGKEDHGTHFEISVSEKEFHYLMLPGHFASINLLPEQKKYLKFSYPGKSSSTADLFLQLEPSWGSFVLYLDKSEKYPNETSHMLKEDFKSQKQSLSNSLRNIKLSERLQEFSLQGTFFLTIEAESSTHVNLKFYEKSPSSLSIHTLSAGKQETGILNTSKEIIYYTIKISLESNKASSVSVDLTPLKGSFLMFAQRTGKLPSQTSNEIQSSNNHLELSYKNYEDHHEYIIGIKADTNNETNNNLDYQFKIGLSYSNKPFKLTPGVLTTHTVNESNYYLIEILKEMNDLIVFKSIVDGYNLQLCGNYGNEEQKDIENCEEESDDQKMGIFVIKEKLDQKCKNLFDKGSRCFLTLFLKGNVDQMFSIGYTYNDLPFQLVKNSTITGPTILRLNYKINFIYHALPDESIGLYFNSKGRKTKILTKLVSADQFKDSSTLEFPNTANFDRENAQMKGYITTIFYEKEEIIAKQNNPEILISILPDISATEESKEPFDLKKGFILQAFLDSKEILRTQVHGEHFLPEEYYFFNFYNNGNSKTLSVYVNANNAALLEVAIAQDKNSKPPTDTKPLLTKKGISQVILDLSTISELKEKNLKGFYSIGVKSRSPAFVNIYWNNKPNFDYIELTPGIPSVLHTFKLKQLYFNFFVDEISDLKRKQKHGNIVIHFKADSQTSLYILKSDQNDLLIPGKNDFNWKADLGNKGGIGFLEITPNEEKYCVNCSYIGSIVSENDGQVSILVNVEHSNIPVTLVSGFTFPDNLASHKEKTYRFYNTDNKPFYINISMLSGTCNVFVDNKKEVDASNAKEFFFLSKNLEVHKYIKIDPEKYQMEQGDFYINVKNPKLDGATFNLSIYKNNEKNPIERGITKFIEISSKETVSLFFVQQKNEKEFDLRLTLRKVDDRKNIAQALENIGKIMSVQYEHFHNPITIDYKNIQISGNKVYMEFDISESDQGYFTIKLENPNEFGMNISIDLISGKYKLVNSNDNIIESNLGKESNIYESFCHKGREWFFELKLCYGQTKVSFYETDFDQIENKKFVENKVVEDNGSFVHYFRPNSSRIFAKVENELTDKSVYSISVYNREDLDDSPYQEIVQKEDGRVQISTDSKTISFEPLKINNFNENDYTHKVVYQAFISPDFKTMRYSKNCGMHLMDKVLNSPEIIKIEKEFYFEGTEEFNAAQKVILNIPDLDKNKQYYGVVIADVNLLPRDEGWIEPIRDNKSYYDEFIIIGNKMEIPMSLWTWIIMLSGVFIVIVIFLNNYIFGDVGKFRELDSLVKTATESGINTLDILESEFKVDEEETQDVLGENQKKETKNNDIEMTERDDKKAPLDVDQ